MQSPANISAFANTTVKGKNWKQGVHFYSFMQSNQSHINSFILTQILFLKTEGKKEKEFWE